MRASLRLARPDDAERLAWVHVRSWQQAYAGLLPADYLDGLTARLPARAEQWRQWLSSETPWVAESDGEIVGFAFAGPSLDEDEDAESKRIGQVWSIYLLAEHWGAGVGRALMEAALRTLREAGFREATLWVLASNERARRFYEAGGWALDGASKSEQREGFTLDEVRYRLTL